MLLLGFYETVENPDIVTSNSVDYGKLDKLVLCFVESLPELLKLLGFFDQLMRHIVDPTLNPVYLRNDFCFVFGWCREICATCSFEDLAGSPIG